MKRNETLILQQSKVLLHLWRDIFTVWRLLRVEPRNLDSQKSKVWLHLWRDTFAIRRLLGVGSFPAGLNFIDRTWNEDRKEKRHEEASLTKFTNHLINLLIWYWSISLDGFSRHEGPLYTFICITLRTKRASHAHFLFLSIVDVEDNHQTV